MIEEILKDIGLNEKEILVYLSILEHGRISNTAVSKMTKINRTTVYGVAKELIKKGIIEQIIGGLNTYYQALSVEELQLLYKKEEVELEKKKEKINLAIKELSLLPKSKKYSVPKIKFIEEYQLEDFLYKRLPTWIENTGSNEDYWWGFQDSSVLEEYPEWSKYFWEKLPKNIGVRIVTNKKLPENKISKELSHLTTRRQVKYLDKKSEFSASYQVIGNYVIFLVTSQHPHYLVEIHDSVMAENLRGIFKEMWNKL